MNNPFIRLSKTIPPLATPNGVVDLVYDAASGKVATREGIRVTPIGVSSSGGASAWSALADRATAPLTTENTGLVDALSSKAPVANPAFNGIAAFEGLTEGVASLGNSTGTRTLSIATATSLETTLTGNCTFTMPTLVAGKSFVLDVLTGAGGFTPTFTGVTWAGGVTPAFPTTATTRITLGFRTNAVGTVWLGSVAGAGVAWPDITGKPSAVMAYADAADSAARRALIGAGTSAWSDITGKPAAVTILSGTNTGDQTPTSLGLVVGTNVQAYDADLTAIAALATTAHGRSLLTSADATASRGAIGAGTSNLPAYLALTAVPVFGAASTPVITAIGQGAIVTHSDGSQTEWGAVSMTLWKPRTAGILLHYSNKFYQASLAADGTAEYTILLNQPPANL